MLCVGNIKCLAPGFQQKACYTNPILDGNKQKSRLAMVCCYVSTLIRLAVCPKCNNDNNPEQCTDSSLSKSEAQSAAAQCVVGARAFVVGEPRFPTHRLYDSGIQNPLGVRADRAARLSLVQGVTLNGRGLVRLEPGNSTTRPVLQECKARQSNCALGCSVARLCSEKRLPDS